MRDGVSPAGPEAADLGPLKDGERPRVLAVAYDVGPRSPAGPRVASLLTGLSERGHRVILWTESEPGGWAEGLDVRRVADPVLALYRRCVDRGAGGASPVAEPPVAAAAERRSPPRWRRVAARAQRALLFPDNESLWSRRVARRVARAVRPGDLVWTFARPESVGFAGVRAAARGARWWADHADGWCFGGLRDAAMTPGPRRERELGLERRWIAAADVVSTVNDELADWFAGLRPGRPVFVYPNLIPDELLTGVDPAEQRRLEPDAPVVVGYFGRLAGSDPRRSLAPFLELLADPAADRRVRFRFRGEFTGRDRQELAALARLGPAVEVLPALPRAELVEFRAEVDAALMIASPEQRGSSSKLLDNLGLQLPVFAVVPEPSLAADIVRRAGCGAVVGLGAPLAPGAVGTWNAFLKGVREGGYGVTESERARFTSAVCVPPMLDAADTLLAGRVPTHERHVRTD